MRRFLALVALASLAGILGAVQLLPELAETDRDRELSSTAFNETNSSQQARTLENEASSRFCETLVRNGPRSKKADLVVIPAEYPSQNLQERHVEYYLDLDGDNRGLFGVYPMNVSKEKFNIWIAEPEEPLGYYGGRDEGRGLVGNSKEVLQRCEGDFGAVLSYDGFEHRAFTVGDIAYVPDLEEKVPQQNGAVGLNHEWGHAFADLKDEYSSPGGPDKSGKPNCAPTREKAEQWWGDMADVNPNVGFEQGCAYSEDNWEPHPGGTIMGDGGLWRYGPVNDRAIFEELSRYS